MATITIRTDKATEEALRELTQEGATRSDVIRQALLQAASEQRRAKLRAEAEAIRNDPADLKEVARVLSDMESLRAW